MHTKAKTRLMLIWLMLAFILLCSISITLIFASTNQTLLNIGMQFTSPNGLKENKLEDVFTFTSLSDTEVSINVKSDATIPSTLVIPKTYNGKTVTAIANSAFRYNTNITEVIIQDNVTSIGNYAFSGCTGLTNIIIPNSVTTIGDSAFENCSGLTSVTIPSNVTNIGSYAFCSCGLDYIYGGSEDYKVVDNCLIEVSSKTLILGSNNSEIPRDSSVEILGVRAFDDCSIKGNGWLTIPDNIKRIEWGCFWDCTGIEHLIIGENVEYIGQLAICQCEDLTQLILLGSGLKTIDSEAFYGCRKLKSVYLPSSLISIGEGAFGNCTSLESLTINPYATVYHDDGNCIIETASKKLIAGCKTSVIPTDGSVTSIGERAFYVCTELTSITIPDSVTSIKERAFESCKGLKSITIPDSVTNIGEKAFYYCTGLSSVTIGSGITYLYDYVFSYCTGLTSITIPSNITGIGKYAFHCSGLTSITIPKTVNQIAAYAFSYCSNLTKVTFAESENRKGWLAKTNPYTQVDITDPAINAKELTTGEWREYLLFIN